MITREIIIYDLYTTKLLKDEHAVYHQTTRKFKYKQDEIGGFFSNKCLQSQFNFVSWQSRQLYRSLEQRARALRYHFPFKITKLVYVPTFQIIIKCFIPRLRRDEIFPFHLCTNVCILLGIDQKISSFYFNLQLSLQSCFY